MGAEWALLILAAMILMTIAVMVLFSHVRYRLLPVGIVAVGSSRPSGSLGLFGIPVSMVVVAAFPVLIGVGIDYAIQFQARFDEETRHSPLPEAVWTTITQMGPSILIAMTATALGFIAMFFAPVPMIADFGKVCAIGVASCYVAALIIVPVFGILTGYRPKKETDISNPAPGSKQSFIERYEHLIGRMAYAIAKHPLPVLLIFGVVAVGGYYLDEKVPISADEKTFVPDTMSALRDMEKITRTMGATSTIPVVVTGDNVLSAETLAWIDRFGTYELEHNDKMTGVTSIATLIRTITRGSARDEGEVDEVVARIRRVLSDTSTRTWRRLFEF